MLRVTAAGMIVVAILMLVIAAGRCDRGRPLEAIVRTPQPPWFWHAQSPGGGWRASEPLVGIAFVDDVRAIAASRSRLFGVELATGRVSPLHVMPLDVKVFGIERVGDRVVVLATGGDDEVVAWEIRPLSLALQAIELVDPPVKEAQIVNSNVAVSPDHTRLVTCSGYRRATVRDAKTLAVLRVLPEVSCFAVHFEDERHAVFSSVRIDVVTGRVSAAPREDVVGGPGGRRFTAGAARAMWAPDGSRVVSWSDGIVRVHSDRARDREIRLPRFSNPRMAIRGSSLLLVEDTVIVAIDLATGDIRTPAGELRDIRDLEPRDGAIITASDRVRIRRGRAVERETPGSSMASDRAIRVVDGRELVAWDPASATRTRIATFAREPSAVEATRAGTLVVVGQRVYNGAAPWIELADDVQLEAIDPTGSRVVARGSSGRWVIETDRKRIAPLEHLGLCDEAGAIRFSQDGTRAAIENYRRIVVLDTATWQRVVEIPLGVEHRIAWAMTSTHEIVIARSHEIEIWDLHARTASTWVSPSDDGVARAVVDAAERELAILTDGNALLWIDLAGLRRNANGRRALPELPPQPCAIFEPPPRYDAIVRHL
jgi:hypothetical protein